MNRFSKALLLSAALASAVYGAVDRFNPALCSRTSSLSPWDQYICKSLNGPKLMPQCVPGRRTPANPRTSPGLMVLFHGYSACPDALDSLADALQAKGFHVLTPLLPGHGRALRDCVEGPNCVKGYSVEGVPTKRQAYVEEVAVLNNIIQLEAARLGMSPKTHTIGAFGLSLGAPTAFLAAAEAPTFWTRLLMANPFFGIADAGIDSQALSCDANTRSCVETFARNILKALREQFSKTRLSVPELISDAQIQRSSQGLADLLQFFLRLRYGDNPLLGRFQELQSALRFAAAWGIENPDNLPQKVVDFLEGEYGWGDECENASRDRNRGGFCQFRVKHLFSAHSFGQYVLARASDVKIETAVMMVERDGVTRNSLGFEAAQVSSASSKIPAQVCIFRQRPNCNITVESGNTCGVPHSMFSRSEQLGNKPFNLYWENYLVSQVVDYFSLNGAARKPLGTAVFNNDPSICHRQDVNKPDEKLAADIPGHMIVFFNLPPGQSVLEFERQAIQKISNSLGINSNWVLNSLYAGRNFASQGAKMVLELPKNMIDSVMSGIRGGRISTIEGTAVTGAESPGKGSVAVPPRR